MFNKVMPVFESVSKLAWVRLRGCVRNLGATQYFRRSCNIMGGVLYAVVCEWQSSGIRHGGPRLRLMGARMFRVEERLNG